MGDPEFPDLIIPVTSPPVVTPFAAAWPSRTWTPTEKVTAGMMNSLRDQLNELHVGIAGGAPLASPAFTGNPTAPTPPAADNDTSIATSAFVQGELAARAGIIVIPDASPLVVSVAAKAAIYRIVLGANRTLNAPTNPTDGQKMILHVFANAAPFTLTLVTTAGGFRFGADITAPLTVTAANKTDWIGCIYMAAFNLWDVVAYSKGY